MDLYTAIQQVLQDNPEQIGQLSNIRFKQEK